MPVEVQDADYYHFIRTSFIPIFPSTFPLPKHARAPFLHNHFHDIESLFWIGFHALFSTVPAKYPKNKLGERLEQRRLFNAFFPHRLEGSTERRRFFARQRFDDDTAEALPTEYKSVVKVLLFIRRVLVYQYNQVEKLPNFPQHEHFNQVYDPEQRNVNLFLVFEAAAEAAYSGETQLLLQDEGISIVRPRRALETSDDADGDDDQIYIFDDLEQAECSEDDEEPPHKMRRTGSKTKENLTATGSSYHRFLKQEYYVERTHSACKRKRSL